MKKLLLMALAGVVLACAEKGEELPPSSGTSGTIYLIMDAEQWRGELGKLLDSTFNAEMAGLPHQETIFKMRWIDPLKLNFVLKQGRNLIFVTTLDQRTSGAAIVQRLFTKESLEKIRTEPDLFVRSTANVFAKNQEVMYLFGNTSGDLIRNIRKNKQSLLEHFNRRERERLTASLFKKEVKGIRSWINQNFQADLRVPFGYKLVQNEKDFLWVRQINPKDDKDIFIARKRYVSQDQFKKDSLIAYRDKVCKKYLFADPDRPDTYVLTETSVPFLQVESTQINFNNHYAMETRGIWRTNNLSMGGPFLSYTLVDEKEGWLYYLEGFTFSPSRDQREIMRELETILYTFRTSDQLPSSPAQKN